MWLDTRRERWVEQSRKFPLCFHATAGLPPLCSAGSWPSRKTSSSMEYVKRARSVALYFISAEFRRHAIFTNGFTNRGQTVGRFKLNQTGNFSDVQTERFSIPNSAKIGQPKRTILLCGYPRAAFHVAEELNPPVLCFRTNVQNAESTILPLDCRKSFVLVLLGVGRSTKGSQSMQNVSSCSLISNGVKFMAQMLMLAVLQGLLQCSRQGKIATVEMYP